MTIIPETITPREGYPMLNMRQVSDALFAGAASPKWLGGEIGLSMTGYWFAEKAFTKRKHAEAFKESFRFISAEPINGPGVYVVGYGRYVKIGVSIRVSERISTLRTSVPTKGLKLHAVLAGTQIQEYALHRRFSAHRSNGEWFRRSGALAKWIDGGCQ